MIALDEATQSIEDIASAHADVVAGAGELRAARRAGRGWPEIIQTDRHRALISRLNQMVNKAADGVSRLRRALIVALRSDGFTVEQIARHFGVSHQRISSVLRSQVRDAGPSGHERGGLTQPHVGPHVQSAGPERPEAPPSPPDRPDDGGHMGSPSMT